MKLLSQHITKRIDGDQFYFASCLKWFKSQDYGRNSMAVVCFYLLLMAFYGLTSCQKVISIDLNSASPQLVVEANVSNKPGPYFVKLSNTVNFSEITGVPAVTGAIVVISDSSGQSETLNEVSNGIYRSRTLRGTPGHKYTLTVKTGGPQHGDKRRGSCG